MKFFKDKNKYVDEKEVRLRNFLLKNKNNYSSDEYDYLINHYGDLIEDSMILNLEK